MNIVRVTAFDIRGLTETEYNLLYKVLKNYVDYSDGLQPDRDIIENIIKMMVY